jgi:hypothetical protein
VGNHIDTNSVINASLTDGENTCVLSLILIHCKAHPSSWSGDFAKRVPAKSYGEIVTKSLVGQAKSLLVRTRKKINYTI